MAYIERLNLQLLAEGGGDGGGEGAATGESAGDPGQRLLELGVPAEKIRKRQKSAPVKLPEGAVRQAEQQTAQPVAEAEKTEEAEPAKKGFTDEDKKAFLADPERNAWLQSIISGRVKSEKSAEETLSKFGPAIEVLARKYDLDVENMDYDALVEAINNDSQYYEDKALEMGVPVETAKKIDQNERETARRQREEARTLEQQKVQEHIQKLQDQGEAMKQTFPSFDLRKELQNPVFARMTSPSVGLSVEDAYYAVHRKEIQAASMKVTADAVKQKISNSIQAGQKRPAENGISGQAASVTSFDYRKASKEQREALKKEIYAAKARGEKLYPGR